MIFKAKLKGKKAKIYQEYPLLFYIYPDCANNLIAFECKSYLPYHFQFVFSIRFSAFYFYLFTLETSRFTASAQAWQYSPGAATTSDLVRVTAP